MAPSLRGVQRLAMTVPNVVRIRFDMPNHQGKEPKSGRMSIARNNCFDYGFLEHEMNRPIQKGGVSGSSRTYPAGLFRRFQ
ncbi:MAG: hypothetical protein LBE85_04865, partial [Candidatus Accumulibacter sp.]|nr:hypothetical protein [Accumulibacter sp.]